jgi:hypothetical protein
MRGLSLLLAGSFAVLAGTAVGQDCGFERPACNSCSGKMQCARPSCCCKHHGHCLHRHCKTCCEQPAAPAPRGSAPPSGPIYESVGMARAMPMMAMPVMMASYPAMPRAAVYEEAPRQARESTCSSSASELELLKERFERLHARVNTLQDSMETQTAILRKITDKLDDLDKKVSK